MLQIGNIRVNSGCLLAPLAGISDLPFRLINREFGCEFAYTEMISARSLVYDSRKTLQMTMSLEGDSPLGFQLLGSDPDVLAEAAQMASRMDNVVLIDLNAACPVNKVVGKDEGASLMKDPLHLKRLLKSLVAHTDLPVTVKIRAGWDDASLNAVDVALHASDAGISGLCIHGRTRQQGYSGSVDYDIIRRVKEKLDVPVIGSGDALSPLLIKKMFDETGCDGVMIARGALGNPWIFKQTELYLKSGTVPDRPDVDEIKKVMTRHLSMQCQMFGEERGTIMFRKLFGWYVKSLRNIKKLREKAFHTETSDQMTSLIEEIGRTA